MIKTPKSRLKYGEVKRTRKLERITNNVNDDLIDKFLTTKEKALIKTLKPLATEERLWLETLADYLIDAAIDTCKK